MKELIGQHGGLVGFIIAVAMALNLALSGLAAALDSFAKKTENKTDDKIVSGMNKVIKVLQTIIDWGGGNRKH